MPDCRMIFKGGVTKLDYIYTILAAIIAGGGFALDSETILIGSMLLSPLLKPLLKAFKGIIKKSPASFFRNVAHLVAMSAITFAVGAIYGNVSRRGYLINVNPDELINSTALSGRTLLLTDEGRLHIRILSVISIAAGVALALSTYHDSGIFSSIVVGVSISTAILPPLVAAGLSTGIKRDEWDIIPGERNKMALSGIMLSLLNIGLIFVSFGITSWFLCSGAKRR